MKSLPTGARVYLALIRVSGIVCLVLCFQMQRSLAPTSWTEWLLLLPVSTLLGTQKVRISGTDGSDDAAAITLSFVAVILCLLWLGPLGAAVAAILCGLSSCLSPPRQTASQTTFNLALAVMEAWVAAVVFPLVNGGYEHLRFPLVILAIACVASAMFLISVSGVSGIVALVSGKSFFELVRSMAWSAPSYFAGAFLCTLATVLLRPGNDPPPLVGVVFLLAPLAYLGRQTFQVHVSRDEERRRRIEQLQESQRQLSELYLATIRSLALAIDAKDQYTHQHILRVQRYSLAVANELGVDGDDLLGLETGALLHDIGKLGVPEYILLKPGKLTPDEFSQIKKHPEIGAAILEPVPFPWPVLPVVRYHHEKWDGSGYPEGLKGEEIPRTARILAVADVYDALTSTRSYRDAWTHEKAVATIREGSGTHFDPVVVTAFLSVIDHVVEAMAREGTGPLAAASGAVIAPTSELQVARDIRRASVELWALYEVSRTLAGSFGAEATLKLLMQKLEEALPGTACLILLAEPDDQLVVRAAVGLNHQFFASARATSPQSVSQQTLATGTPFCGEYDFEDLDVSAISGAWTELNSALIVPMIHNEERIGTIHLYHPEPHAFSDEDVRLLQRLADLVALALSPQSPEEAGALLQRVLDEQKSVDEPFALLRIAVDGWSGAMGEVIALLRRTVRDRDLLVPLGESEVLVLLRGADLVGARQSAERLSKYLGTLGCLHQPVRARTGIACFPDDGREVRSLLAEAAPLEVDRFLRQAA
jgi:putative nucleotidyltransferase with HDIG domain